MRKSGLIWLWVSLLVVLLDQLTKELAQFYLLPYNENPIFPGFNLTLSFNKGSAFGFLHQAPGWQGWLFGIIAISVSLAIIIWLTRLSKKQWGLCIALSLIVGGALGNLLDRILYGQVTDFLQLYIGRLYWPTFNVADSAICVGAFILFLQSIRDKEGKKNYLQK